MGTKYHPTVIAYWDDMLKTLKSGELEELMKRDENQAWERTYNMVRSGNEAVHLELLEHTSLLKLAPGIPNNSIAHSLAHNAASQKVFDRFDAMPDILKLRRRIDNTSVEDVLDITNPLRAARRMIREMYK